MLLFPCFPVHNLGSIPVTLSGKHIGLEVFKEFYRLCMVGLCPLGIFENIKCQLDDLSAVLWKFLNRISLNILLFIYHFENVVPEIC